LEIAKMANYYAMAAVSAALRGLLRNARGTAFSQAEVELLQVADFQKPTPMVEGVSILLYRIAISAMPRTLSSHFDASGRRKAPSLPVDLYYLLTPWGKSPAMQQRILGWLMRTLEDMTTFNGALLNQYGGPEIVFGETESVSLIFEPLPLQELSNLWDLLRPNAHLSVAYVARAVHLESPLEPLVSDLVQTREVQYTRVQ